MNRHVFDTFILLGKKLRNDRLRVPFKSAFRANNWFDEASIKQAIWGIVQYLNKEDLEKWLKHYKMPSKSKTIGLIPAGNIPLVGFHDLLCILISGHSVSIKPSSKDAPLTEWIIKQLFKINPKLMRKIKPVKTWKKCDAFIATGSDNTSRYFEYELRNKPLLVRKNKTSIAILTGTESPEELDGLTGDIFSFYGLGCRNVSCLVIPKGYNVKNFSTLFSTQRWRMNNQSWRSNYQYNKALLKINRQPFLDFGNLLMCEDTRIFSPVAMVNYHYYQSDKGIMEFLDSHQESLQCVVGARSYTEVPSIPFGTTQFPRVWEYQDRKDTMEFLSKL